MADDLPTKQPTEPHRHRGFSRQVSIPAWLIGFGVGVLGAMALGWAITAAWLSKGPSTSHHQSALQQPTPERLTPRVVRIGDQYRVDANEMDILIDRLGVLSALQNHRWPESGQTTNERVAEFCAACDDMAFPGEARCECLGILKYRMTWPIEVYLNGGGRVWVLPVFQFAPDSEWQPANAAARALCAGELHAYLAKRLDPLGDARSARLPRANPGP